MIAIPSLLLSLAGCSVLDFIQDDNSSRPEVSLVSPADGAQFTVADTIEFVFDVSDDNDPLVAVSLGLQSDLDGSVCRTVPGLQGEATCMVMLSQGVHAMDATVRDNDDRSSTIAFSIIVTGSSTIDGDGDGISEADGDCDDSDATIFPGATELEDGIDQDCDGLVDEGTNAYDDDGDGVSENDGDCDDTDASVFPGATELYNGVDDNCDGEIDEGIGTDDDFDGYTELDGDCDDTDASTYPGAIELLDGRDNDCDGVVDEETAAYDDDGDGYSEAAGDCDDSDALVNPDAVELSDAVDNDCDGEIDEADGSYVGTVVLEASGDGAVESCEADLTIEVVTGAEPELSASFSCGGIEDGALSASFTDAVTLEGELTGTLYGAAAVVPMSADLTVDTIDGSFDGTVLVPAESPDTGDTGSADVEWSVVGSFTATRG